MTSLLIVGAGGFGRELVAQALNDSSHGKDWIVEGFLDGRTEILKKYPIDIPILGDPLTFKIKTGQEFLMALADPKDKIKYSENLLSQGAKFISLMTWVDKGPRVKIGTGCIFGLGVELSVDCEIGDYVSVQAKSMIGHDVKIGTFSHIGSQCFIAGDVEIGKGVTIHPKVAIATGSKIGDFATIGIGSVVFGKIPPGATVLGNPAKRMDLRSENS